ncbi:MAG: hypothetical protein Tsb0015_10020 [Simkaniaceae bacterium]
MTIKINKNDDFKSLEKIKYFKQVCSLSNISALTKEDLEGAKKKLEKLLQEVLHTASGEVLDREIEDLEAFVEKVTLLDRQYHEYNFGNPFASSIEKLQEKILAAKPKEVKEPKKENPLERSVVKSLLQFDPSGIEVEKAEKIVPVLKNLIEEFTPFISESKNEAEEKKLVQVCQKIEEIILSLESQFPQKDFSEIKEQIFQLKYAFFKEKSPAFKVLTKEKLPEVIIELSNYKKIADSINKAFQNYAGFFRPFHIDKKEALRAWRHLYILDQKMLDAGVSLEEHPLKPSIDLLENHLNLPSKERTATASRSLTDTPKEKGVSEKIAMFRSMEKTSTTISIKIASPTTTRTSLSEEEKKKRFLSRLSERLQSPHLVPSEVIQDIERNKSKYDTETQQQLTIIQEALTVYSKPESFHPTLEELVLLKHWETEFSKYKMKKEYSRDDIEFSKLETKKYLLSLINDNAGSLQKLSKILERQLPTLDTRAVEARFKRLVVHPETPENFHGKFAGNFALLVDHLARFGDTARKVYKEKWESCQKYYDRKTNGKFSQIVSSLGYANVFYNFDEDYEILIKDYIRDNFNNELFSKTYHYSAEKIILTLNSLESTKVITKFFKMIYDRLYKKTHLWIRDHAEFIKISYDQGLDHNYNLKDGTCEQNSLYRHTILLENPEIPFSAIPMRSTEKGRFNGVIRQLIREEAISDKKLNSIEEAKLYSLFFETFARFDLKFVEPVAVVTKKGESSIDALIRILRKNNKTTSLLVLKPENGGIGHAINIQIDPARKIYRFIDDNLGVIECPDLEAFKETLSSWLVLTYPDLPNLFLKMYEKI